MNSDQDREYDYTCEICGKGYFAEVGFSIGCGNHTEGEISNFFEQKSVEQERMDKLMVSYRRRLRKSYHILDEDTNDEEDMRDF